MKVLVEVLDSRMDLVHQVEDDWPRQLACRVVTAGPCQTP